MRHRNGNSARQIVTPLRLQKAIKTMEIYLQTQGISLEAFAVSYDDGGETFTYSIAWSLQMHSEFNRGCVHCIKDAKRAVKLLEKEIPVIQ